MSQKTTTTVVSNVTGQLSLTSHALRFSRTFARKGHKMEIETSILDELMYEPGVAYMFRTGMLSIVDETPEIYIEKGIFYEPNQMPKWKTDKERKELLKLSLPEFRKELKAMTREMQEELFNFVVDTEYLDANKLEIIRTVMKKDAYKAIQLNRQNKEVVEVQE